MKRLPSFLAGTCGAIGISMLLACSGQVGESNGNSGGAGGPPTQGGTGNSSSNTPGTGSSTGNGGAGTTPGTAATGAGDATAAGPRPLTLLNRREYLNTVRDLFGDTTLTPDALPEEDEDTASGFVFRTSGTVATLDSNLYRDAAEAIARNAVPKIATFLPCAPAAGTEDACSSTFITTFGPKLFRRPLTPADITNLTALYQTGRGALALGFNDTIGFMIEAILQSPEFLYHWEVQQPAVMEGAVVKLGNYELASRLSYLIWGSLPDQMLFDAASKGQLGDAASVEAQVRRMVKDPKASSTILNFFTDWLDIDLLPNMPKDSTVYPMYNAPLTTAMSTEFATYINTIASGSGRFDDFMMGTNSFANQALAAIYGVTGVTGTGMKPVVMNPAQRAGLLTMASFLSVTGPSIGTTPPRRGKAIYYKMLCGSQLVVPMVVPPAADPSTGGTTRSRFEAHSMLSCTGICHKDILDPLGFAFENYDGIGRYRTTDNNLPVDASVTLKLDGKSVTAADGVALIKALTASDQVQTCFATQWFRYGLGRFETPGDQNSISTAANTFKGGTRDVRELMVAVATSRTFRYRSPATGEVLK